MSARLMPTMTVAYATYFEIMLVSLVSDKNLKPTDRANKVDAAFKKMEQMAKVYGNFQHMMHERIPEEATNAILLRK